MDDVLHAADGEAEAERLAQKTTVVGMMGKLVGFRREIAETAETADAVDVIQIGGEIVVIEQEEERPEPARGRIERTAEKGGAKLSGRNLVVLTKFLGKVFGHDSEPGRAPGRSDTVMTPREGMTQPQGRSTGL